MFGNLQWCNSKKLSNFNNVGQGDNAKFFLKKLHHNSLN
jgi:hypothetical protein